MNELGFENFHIALVEGNIPNKETAYEREIYYIDKFRTFIIFKIL